MPPQAPTRAFLVSHLLVSSVFWATGFLFIKLSGPLDPFVVAAMRGLIGAAALAIWFMAAGRDPRPQRTEWRHWLVLGTFNGWGPNVLVAYALTQIGTAPAAMIQAASPLVVAALAHLLFAEERLTLRRLAGVLVGLSGMAVLIGPAALPGRDAGALGALAMAAVALSYAVGNLYARMIREAEPARLALGQQVCSGLPATVLALMIAGPAAFAPVADAVLPLLGLGVLATAVPVVFFMRLIRGAGPTRAAMMGYLMPVWTTILAILFLGETVGLRELLGGLIVLAGVAIVSFTGRVAR